MKTIKRTASMLLALVMVVSLCTVGASATNPDITAYAYGEEDPVGTYTTIDAAATAAGVNGRIVLGSGIYEFNGRQTISVEGITLEGAGMTGTTTTTMTTSAAYANASTTNRKALLTIAASNVTVKNLIIDGGTYGANLVPTNSVETEFNVVRVNSGSATLQNVKILNSTRTLLSVGTSTTSATVTATGLYCEGSEKTLTDDITYADISIVNGTFTLGSGSVVNAFISTDHDTGTGTFVNNCTANHYTMTCTILFSNYDLTSTLKHFVESYVECTSWIDRLVEANAITNNLTVVHDMVTEAVTNVQTTHSTEDITIATNFRAELNSAKSYATSNQKTTIDTEIARLDAVLT